MLVERDDGQRQLAQYRLQNLRALPDPMAELQVPQEPRRLLGTPNRLWPWSWASEGDAIEPGMWVYKPDRQDEGDQEGLGSFLASDEDEDEDDDEGVEPMETEVRVQHSNHNTSGGCDGHI